MPPQIAKAVATITAFALSLFNSTPQTIREQIAVLVAFVAIDTFTGVWTAFACRDVASKRMISKLVTKASQYAILITLAGGAGLLAHNVWIVQGGLLALLGVEALSMLENLCRLQYCGGVNMGPAKPFLDRVSKYFAVMQDPPSVNSDGQKGTVP